MEELYAEGLATHSGPESCVASCEGRGEALTGARAGRAIEPRNVTSGCPRRTKDGRQHRRRRFREPSGDPARSENHGTSGTFVRENREVPRLPARVVCGRAARGNASAGSPWVHGRGKSDQLVVPASLPNEAEAEEAGEGRS